MADLNFIHLNKQDYGYNSLSPNELKGLNAACAYVYLANNNYLENVDSDLIKCANNLLKDYAANDINRIKDRLSRLDKEGVKQFLLSINHLDNGISRSINQPTGSYLTPLIYSLLDIKDRDRVIDLGSGDGTMLVELNNLAQKDNKQIEKLYGIEINPKDANISRLMIAIFTDGKQSYEVSNTDALLGQDFKFNKGYVYPPIGEHRLFRSSDFNSFLYPDIAFRVSFYEQWTFVDRLLYGLEGSDARGVALLFGKSLLQSDRNTFLQRLLDDGWIEGIIELPNGAIPGTMTRPYLVIFSRNNSAIKIMSVKEHNHILPNLEDVASSYFNDDSVVTIPTEKAKTLQYLTPGNLLAQNDAGDKQGYISLKDVASIFVGTQNTSSRFEEAQGDSPYYILTSSDIEDGLINWNDLKNVYIDNPRYTQYTLSKNDVVITTKSTRVKVAVVDQELNNPVIVTGGMIVVRPLLNRLNPYYLKLYLESSEGAASLKMMQTGTTIINISPRMFMDLKIPNVDIAIQNKKASVYLDKVSSIRASRERIAKLQEEISHILDEEEE